MTVRPSLTTSTKSLVFTRVTSKIDRICSDNTDFIISIYMDNHLKILREKDKDNPSFSIETKKQKIQK